MVGWLMLRPCVSTRATGAGRQLSLDDQGRFMFAFYEELVLCMVNLHFPVTRLYHPFIEHDPHFLRRVICGKGDICDLGIIISRQEAPVILKLKTSKSA